MAPKKAGGDKASAKAAGDGGAKKGKKAGKGKEGAADGKQIEVLQKQLQQAEERIRQEAIKRNEMEVERDMVSGFWEISRAELDVKQGELRNKAREVEEAAERHDIEVKVYKQKVKHLLYEHQHNINTLKADAELAVQMAAEDWAKKQEEIINDKRQLKAVLHVKEGEHEDIVNHLKIEHAKQLSKLRQEFEGQAVELEAKYARRLQLMRDDADVRRRADIHEIEERKNAHIQQLMAQHDKAMEDMRSYYNDITSNNLDLIKTLKEQLTEAKAQEVAREKVLAEVVAENQKLKEPLANATRELDRLKAALADAQRDKAQLKQKTQLLAKATSALQQCEWDKELLLQQQTKLQQEYDNLHMSFESSILEVQQRAALKVQQLHQRMELMLQQLQGNTDHLSDGQTAAPAADKLAAVTQQLGQLFSAAPTAKSPGPTAGPITGPAGQQGSRGSSSMAQYIVAKATVGSQRSTPIPASC